MKFSKVYVLPLLLLFATGCSGFGTTMTKVGRMGENKGYEIAADLTIVRQASADVLRARGYEVSIKDDPQSGAEGAGQIVIGQQVARYVADSATVSAGNDGPKEVGTRDLVNIYLSKKWQMDSNVGKPDITLVDVGGSAYLRTVRDGPEEETALTSGYLTLLRDEIERRSAVILKERGAVQ